MLSRLTDATKQNCYEHKYCNISKLTPLITKSMSSKNITYAQTMSEQMANQESIIL